MIGRLHLARTGTCARAICLGPLKLKVHLKSLAEVTNTHLKCRTCQTDLVAYSLMFENVNTIFGNGIGKHMNQVTFVRLGSSPSGKGAALSDTVLPWGCIANNLQIAFIR